MTAYTRGMNQDATYWAPAGNDGYGGVLFAAPVAVKCRWQSKTTLTRGDGQEVTSDTTVYVDRELQAKGYIILGTSASNDPIAAGARQIITAQASPSLDATETLYSVLL